MEALSDDEFDHVRDFELSEPESEAAQDTPSTTPPRRQTPRPSDRKLIPCPYNGCQKTFNRNARLQEHIRSHTNERPFVCPQLNCSKAFLRDTHLKHHLKSAHSDIRDHKCTWEGCEKSFATGTRLRRHIQAHEDKEKFRCRGYEGCNETFRKHETLRKHVATVHENNKPFPCDHVNSAGRKCIQSFQTSDKLKSHQRAVHDETRYSCNECLTKFTDAMQDGELDQEHRNMYFATFKDLQAHIAEVHPPTCPYCPTSFTTEKELTRHLEIQHGILDAKKPAAKVLNCTYPNCNQTFTKRGNLNVHIKTVHEKQRDFVCGITEIPVPEELSSLPDVEIHGCGRSFTSKASLEEHVRTAHFQLQSRRTQRETKRKAEKALDEDQSRARKPRKDKGVKKSSALSMLTGIHEQPTFFPIQTHQGLVDLAFHQPYIKKESDDEYFNDMENGDVDQLSGSMTLCGDHLYHNGQGYQYVSEGSGTASAGDSIMLDTAGQYILCSDSNNTNPTATMTDEAENEPLFNFEHEEEFLGDAIDPVLMRY